MRSDLSSIPDYVPGKTEEDVKRKYGLERVVKLSSNENPYGCSPKAIEVLKNFDSLNSYPSRDPVELREMIAEYVGFDDDMIFISSGLDGVLECAFKLIVEPTDEVCFALPTFPYYSILSKIYRARENRIKRDKKFRMTDYSEKAKLTVVCSPNNPTGNLESQDFVREMVENVKGYVFIDEAYAEFAEKNLSELVEYENVIVGRTFSKAFGLANLRLGYAIMHPDMRKAFMKVNTPFPVSSLAVKAGIAALEDSKWMKETVDMIKKDREWLFRKLKNVARPFKSEANFLYVETEMDGKRVVGELEKKGIIVRALSGFEGARKNAFRVSVGKREENEAFIEALKDVVCSR